MKYIVHAGVAGFLLVSYIGAAFAQQATPEQRRAFEQQRAIEFQKHAPLDAPTYTNPHQKVPWPAPARNPAGTSTASRH